MRWSSLPGEVGSPLPFTDGGKAKAALPRVGREGNAVKEAQWLRSENSGIWCQVDPGSDFSSVFVRPWEVFLGPSISSFVK